VSSTIDGVVVGGVVTTSGVVASDVDEMVDVESDEHPASPTRRAREPAVSASRVVVVTCRRLAIA